MAKRYFIETYGCQMNFHDAERMAGLLEQAGYESTRNAEDADLVVVNTCSVREKAEEKLFNRLGELRHVAQQSGERPLVAVAGCVAQQEGVRLLRKSDVIDVVVGTQRLKELPDLVARAEREMEPVVDINPYEDVTFPLGIARRGDPVKAYINIIEGCNEFCSFCVVPYTRGHERMRPSADILAEAALAAAEGRREIHVLGQIVNHYHAPDDPSCDFSGLLERLHGIEGVDRIRFASPHPRYVTTRLLEIMRELPKICRHLHLPVQSGSTRVLKAMRRRYTRESYLELVGRARDLVPGLTISTDMIVGFPGETPEDFEETLSLTEVVRYDGMFSFKYSPRPNTLAFKRLPDAVPEAEKTRRIVALQRLQGRIQQELHEAMVGTEVDVLVESTSRRRTWEVAGRTEGNTVVNFAGRADLIGALARVRVERAGTHSVWGRVVG
ncbi:MAG: tRNA (N6-isopentenyl adenosine(37)-C2)-methylthiotransferase MiaB, partial [Acidobacteria bacterium]|nr:tRNA (N6-isopentenyl adenosine(37)-C2)-methylthiotransferase MiaB [Acidobacteriota bacterium]